MRYGTLKAPTLSNPYAGFGQFSNTINNMSDNHFARQDALKRDKDNLELKNKTLDQTKLIADNNLAFNQSKFDETKKVNGENQALKMGQFQQSQDKVKYEKEQNQNKLDANVVAFETLYPKSNAKMGLVYGDKPTVDNAKKFNNVKGNIKLADFQANRRANKPQHTLVQDENGEYILLNKNNPKSSISTGVKSSKGGMNSYQTKQITFKEEELKAKKEAALDSKENALISLNNTIESVNSISKSPFKNGGTGWASYLDILPNTDARAFSNQVDALKSQLFLSEIQKMKGMGALSENEGKKLSDAIGVLDPADSKGFSTQLKNISNTLLEARSRLVNKKSTSSQPQGKTIVKRQKNTKTGQVRIVFDDGSIEYE